jgi:hypothetical protein
LKARDTNVGITYPFIETALSSALEKYIVGMFSVVATRAFIISQVKKTALLAISILQFVLYPV